VTIKNTLQYPVSEQNIYSKFLSWLLSQQVTQGTRFTIIFKYFKFDNLTSEMSLPFYSMHSSSIGLVKYYHTMLLLFRHFPWVPHESLHSLWLGTECTGIYNTNIYFLVTFVPSAFALHSLIILWPLLGTKLSNMCHFTAMKARYTSALQWLSTTSQHLSKTNLSLIWPWWPHFNAPSHLHHVHITSRFILLSMVTHIRISQLSNCPWSKQSFLSNDNI